MRFLLFTLFSLVLFSCEKGLTVQQQLQADIGKIEDYLSKNNLVAQSTASGLHYIISVPGSGGHPSLSSKVKVNYVGKILNTGDIFDQTTGTPREFKLNEVIQGWQEGIPLLKRGGKGIFLIPSALGYGPYGSGSIPGNTPLIFDVELIDF
ncbi:MAG: FKBP-type peptidyl-prolyl cis-trans isomerase [Saprospiraceae bacterium]